MLVLGGNTTNEIIDFANPNNYACNFPDFSGDKWLIHSTLRNGKYPLSCASYDDENRGRDCYLYENDGSMKTYFNILREDRSLSASVFVPGVGWWFTAGSTYKSTSEILNIDTLTSRPGPDMPKGLYLHCMVQVNDSHTFVIGGGGYNGNYFDETWLFNWENMEWTSQSNLNVARNRHSCGLHRKDSGLHIKNKVIVAGGYNRYDDNLDLNSTEIFDLDNPESGWKLGPNLPIKMFHASMANLNGHLILVGGFTLTGSTSIIGFRDELYEYTEGGWVQLDQKLQVGRSHHATIFIPDDLLNC